MFRSAHDLLDDKVHEKRDNVQIEGVFGLVSVCWKPGLVPTRGQGAVVAATWPAVDLQLTDPEDFPPAFSGSSFVAGTMTPPRTKNHHVLIVLSNPPEPEAGFAHSISGAGPDLSPR